MKLKDFLMENFKLSDVEADEEINDIKAQMTYGEDVSVILQERDIPPTKEFMSELEN